MNIKSDIMKKLYSTIMMLAMMVAALSLTACGDDDEDDDFGGGGNSPSGNKTLIIDGNSYYCGSLCTLEQTNGSGMYFTIEAVEDKVYQTKGKELKVHISPSKVSQLSVGQVFGYNNMSIRNYRGLTQMELNTYSWDAVSGDITIKSIGETQITIQINSLVVKHKNTEVEHSISGTATLKNTLRDTHGNSLPF